MAITRLYSSADDARSAVAELEADGFRAANIEIYSGNVGTFILEQAGVLQSNAPTYIAAMAKGATLLLVHAPLGTAAAALEILGRKRPSDSQDVTPCYEAKLWDESAPLSSALKIPTVIDFPTIFSYWWNIPTMTDWRPGTRNSSFGLSLAWKNPTPLSSLFGLRVLSKNTGTFSAMIGLPTLI